MLAIAAACLTLCWHVCGLWLWEEVSVCSGIHTWGDTKTLTYEVLLPVGDQVCHRYNRKQGSSQSNKQRALLNVRGNISETR